MHKEIVESIPYFQDKSPSFIAFIGSLLRPIKVNEGDFIYIEGDLAEESLFIFKFNIL